MIFFKIYRFYDGKRLVFWKEKIGRLFAFAK